MQRFTWKGGLQPYMITMLVKANSIKAIINPRPSLVYFKERKLRPVLFCIKTFPFSTFFVCFSFKLQQDNSFLMKYLNLGLGYNGNKPF